MEISIGKVCSVVLSTTFAYAGVLGCTSAGRELGDMPSDDDQLADEDIGSTAEAATTAESVYAIAVANNVNTTGHGNVQFKVFWDVNTNGYRALIWSQNSYGGQGCAYRKWYTPSNNNYFAAWPYAGGALCVEWPPTYSGMNKSMQIVDVDLDGDFDTFQLIETSSNIWTLYLYKNTN